MESLKSPRALTIVVLVTVFVVGLLTGWSLNTSMQKQKLNLNNLDAELRPAVLEKNALEKMKTMLDLNAQQIDEIRPILTTAVTEVIQLRKESLRRISDCRSKYLEQIAVHLNPQQQEIIRSFVRRKDAELQKQLEN